MAVSVITGGVFNKSAGDRPGLYVRFVSAALAAITSGARSKVATIKTNFTGTAVTNKVYRVTSMDQATALFGSANVEDIRLMLIGGASEVVVSTITKAAPVSATVWDDALKKLETYEFHVYVNEFASDATLDTAAYAWLKACKTNGMNFIGVFADEATEGTVASIKTAAAAKADEYIVFVGGGVTNPDGSNVTADKYAAYIAGLIAGTGLDGSLTYKDVPFAEVMTRYRSVDVKDLLTSGVLVTVMDGGVPRIEQGLTLGTAPFNKIRTVRAKQALIDDINTAVKENYIGKVTNNINGQVAVLNAIKAYLETLANGNVIDNTFTAELSKTNPSVGDSLYVDIAVRFLDSIEYVYLTVTV
jgi:hypothetical protein